MKKIILTAAAVFAISFANAQDKKDSGMGFAKGDVYVTGSLSSKSSSISGSDTATEFAPSVGYFLTDNISLEAGFSTAKNGDVKSNLFGLGAAYNFNAKNQFSSRINLSLATGSGTELVDLGGMTPTAFDYKATALSLGYGIRYFVSSHFSLTADVAALNYTSVTLDGMDAESTTELGLNMSNISLGLTYKF
jgi:hypothetical protein